MMRHAYRVLYVPLLAAAVLGCPEKAAELDGYLLQVTLPANFNRALITEVQVVFDTAPGGGSLGLTTTNIGPETTSQGLKLQTQA